MSIILTSPETDARKNPTITARLSFRTDTPIPQTNGTTSVGTLPLTNQEVLVGFTTTGEIGHSANDIVALRVQSGSTIGKWKAVHRVGGGTFWTVTTDVEPEYDVPHDYSVTLGEEVAIYSIDGRVVAEQRRNAPTSALHFEVLTAIYDNPSSDIHREVIIDYVSGSMDR